MPQRQNFQIRQNLALIWNLLALILGENCVKGLRIMKIVNKSTLKEQGRVRSK